MVKLLIVTLNEGRAFSVTGIATKSKRQKESPDDESGLKWTVPEENAHTYAYVNASTVLGPLQQIFFRGMS